MVTDHWTLHFQGTSYSSDIIYFEEYHHSLLTCLTQRGNRFIIHHLSKQSTCESFFCFYALSSKNKTYIQTYWGFAFLLYSNLCCNTTLYRILVFSDSLIKMEILGFWLFTLMQAQNLWSYHTTARGTTNKVWELFKWQKTVLTNSVWEQGRQRKNWTDWSFLRKCEKHSLTQLKQVTFEYQVILFRQY